MLKDYSKFIKEEVTVKGNPAIPGEGGKKGFFGGEKKDKNEKEYLKSAEERGVRNVGLRRADDIALEEQYGRQISDLNRQSFELMVSDLCDARSYFMGRISTQQRERVRERMAKIEELTESVIRSEYEGVLHNVEMDIKIVLPHEVKQFMDEEGDPEPPIPMREITDENIRREIHKRKIANLITQGEAKNTKHILHSEEIKDGINEIFGERKGKQLFDIWDKITKIADKLDWIVPINAKAEMMENAPGGFAGAVSVDWKPKEVKEDTGEEKEDDYDGPKSEPDEDNAPTEQMTPIIRARGVDLPMLLHETVKGIHELIASAGIPEDEEVAKRVLANTDTFADEAEDFRYGPIIASDIRDFVNKNPNWNKHPNIRQHVYGRMYRLPAEEFLKLMRGILQETPEARTKVDGIINKLIEELDAVEMYDKGIYTEPDTENLYGSSYGEEDSDILEPEKEEPKQTDPEKEETGEIDYSKFSKKEIVAAMNAALDSGDVETMKKIHPFLEGVNLKVFESEIKRMLKS